MKVYLVYNKNTKKYYLRKERWSEKIYNESYFTKQASKWHRTYVINESKRYSDTTRHLKPEDIVIEEYEMIKTN